MKHTFKRIAVGLMTGVAGAFLTVSMASAATKPTQSTQAHPSVQSRITNQINHMSWRQKVGQMIVGDGLPNNAREAGNLAKRYDLGGVILETSNMNANPRSMNYRMERATHHSLLIGTDEEGGEVSRLGYNPSRYPSPQEAYRQGGYRRIRSAYGYMGYRLHKLGINWDYAPDADVAYPGSYMYFRAFGHGPKKTARYDQIATQAIQKNHVAATLKHFPGYGNAKEDTDFTPVTSNRSLSYLKRNDFIPFKAGIKAGADSVMVTNIILNRIQRGVPATLSRKDINLLRNDLHFNGVIVTDSLDAVSIQRYARRHHVSPAFLAMKAGDDMIMTQGFRRYIPQLTRAVQHHKISQKQVNASVYRILMMKHKLGLNY